MPSLPSSDHLAQPPAGFFSLRFWAEVLAQMEESASLQDPQLDPQAMVAREVAETFMGPR